MNKALAMILAALTFAAFAVDTNRVTMTRLGSLNPRSGEVVTDVTFEGLADATNVYTKAETDAAIAGKADREMVIGQVKGLPGDCFPIAYVYNGDSYSIANSGGIVVDQIGPAYYRLADSVTGVAVCYFRISDGTYFSNGEASGITFGGTAPTQRGWPVLCDVATKSSVMYDVDVKTNYYDKAETEAKIVELAPAPGNYAAVSNAAINALSRAEAEAGFTEWRPFRPDSGYSLISATYNNGQWTIVVLVDGASEPTTYTSYGSPTETMLTFHGEYDSIIRTRLPTMADIPTAQINAATATNALQDAELESLSDSISTLNDTKASKADATLTERWTMAFALTEEQKEMFSLDAPSASDNDYALTVAKNKGGTWTLYVGSYNAASLMTDANGNLVLSGGDVRLGLQVGDLVATPSGYRLGPDDPSNPNRDKPLASEAEAEALRQGKQDALTAQQIENIAAVPGKADNSDVVHKTGDETIGGTKTFTGGHTVIPFIYAGQGAIQIGLSGRISQATAVGLLDDTYVPNYGEVKSTITAAIREQSLGGIWDAELQVWWTPVMRNGSLTYQATTNVNLNAEN